MLLVIQKGGFFFGRLGLKKWDKKGMNGLVYVYEEKEEEEEEEEDEEEEEERDRRGGKRTRTKKK